MKLSISDYLNELLNNLLASERHQIELTRSWASQFPNVPGVYIFRSADQIVYAGETGSIRGRMKDLIDTRNHVIRRSIGIKLFSNRDDYTKPTSSKKFCDTIEAELNLHITTELTISFIPVELGRKELEKRLFSNYSPQYNIKGLRINS
ncbi:GIY-YIG nuclease family protein [Runella sp.]|uniref:GIY-YIG nuclease family protein n=1 Tax=Runella sp. TaxID=1960881 RepID=UPI003D109600